MILLLASLALATSEKDRALINQLDREVVALKQRNIVLQEQLQSCGSGTTTAPPIYAELTQIFAGTPVTVERKGPLVRVTIPADLLFAGDSNRVRAEAQGTLDLLSTALKLHLVAATVAVYTDSDPVSNALRKQFPTAWEWTAARAVALSRELSEHYAVPAERLTAAARGTAEPVATNDTPEGRQLNRRVVVEVLEQLPPAP